MPWLDAACCEPEGAAELNGCREGACALAEEETALWRPLVLLIPLRLGLSDINEAYIETLKVKHHLLCVLISCLELHYALLLMKINEIFTLTDHQP